MKIVGIGGGTGLPVLLSGLKSINDRGEESLDITAIVAVSDSGGSSGSLRRALEMPAMGDIRNCLIALAAGDSKLVSVCRHRFEKAGGLAGHSVGNLILSALYQMSGDFAAAVRAASELLDLKGRVLPATDVPVTLCAEYQDGIRVFGEANINRTASAIQRVWLEPANPMPAPGVLDAISQADAIVFGPGSLYTSIIANVLVGGVARAIHESAAIKIYICNLMTQPGETHGYSAADHLRSLRSYLPQGTINVCILNSATVGTGVAERYSRSGAETVTGAEAEIRRMGVIPAAAPLVGNGPVKARHDPEALAKLVVSLARGFTGAEQVISSLGNGR